MKIKSNYKFSAVLWISHFLTDAIAAFALTTISVNLININTFIIDKIVWLHLFWYFILYNFIAFFLQIFVWYFLDKINDNNNNFNISKKLIIISFVFYILWVLLLSISYILAIIFIWIWSCLFHITCWNISLLSNKNKATNLWLFASWWVVWLSFWWFSAIFSPFIIIFINIALIFISIYILSYKNYKIEQKTKKNYYNVTQKTKKSLPLILWLLALILIFRSSIWTNFQIEYIMNKWIIFYLAISAFLWKIIGWILEDNENFKEKYFIITGLLSILLIYIYSYHFNHILILLLWIFWIQIFVSPITIILYKLIPENRSKIIWFTFWLSLVLWFLVLKM